MNFRHAAPDVVLAGVGAAAQLARDLDVRTPRQSLCEIAELAPGDDAMPFGSRATSSQERLVATDSTTRVRLFLVVRTWASAPVPMVARGTVRRRAGWKGRLHVGGQRLVKVFASIILFESDFRCLLTNFDVV